LEWINFSESGKSGHFLLDALLSFPYAVYYRERADYLPLCWLLPSQRWPVARRSSATDNVSYWWAGMPNETIADAKATLGIYELEQKYSALQDQISRRPIIVPIQTLAPQDIVVTAPILAVVQEEDGAFTASWFEANIYTCGDTVHDAINAPKELIFDVVQLHLNEPGDSVGEPMKQQRGILARFLCLPSPEPTQKIS
jgi:hypothetical protein